MAELGRFLPEESVSKARWGSGGVMIALSAATPSLFLSQQQGICILLYIIYLIVFVVFNMLQLDRIQQYGIWVLVSACVLIPGHLIFQPAAVLAECIPIYGTLGSLLLWNWPFLVERWHGRPGYELLQQDSSDLGYMEEAIGFDNAAGVDPGAGSHVLPARRNSAIVSSWIHQSQVEGNGQDTWQPGSWPPRNRPGGSQSPQSEDAHPRRPAGTAATPSESLSLSGNGSVILSLSSRCRNLFFPGGIPNRLRTTQSLLDARRHTIGVSQSPVHMEQGSPPSNQTEGTEEDQSQELPADYAVDAVSHNGSDLVRFAGLGAEPIPGRTCYAPV